MSAGQPVSVREFSGFMGRCGPFETRPIIAVGVSGGADSLALIYLLNQWVDRRGGRAIALTVDHGLREESRAEANQVAGWMESAGIDHHILTWEGEKPVSGVQAAARSVRRDRMLSWCRRAGVLHLALAHHRDDQVETYLMRLAHDSGPDGLAGMAGVAEASDARIIRPLLGIPKQRLEATLTNIGCEWLTDPSNFQQKFERVRVRNALIDSDIPKEGRETMLSAMYAFARQRSKRERMTADILARSLKMHPAGYARLNARQLMKFESALCHRVLARVLIAVGGRSYPPNRESLERLFRKISGSSSGRGGSHTLSNCRVAVKGPEVMVYREMRNLPDIRHLAPGQGFIWDNRFRVTTGAVDGLRNLTLRPLGRDGWQHFSGVYPDACKTTVPVAARYSLPGLFHGDKPLFVPYVTDANESPEFAGVSFAFSPKNPALSSVFPLARG